MIKQGQLELDEVRGVLYFHDMQGRTLLRIQGLDLSQVDKNSPGLIDVLSFWATVEGDTTVLKP